VVYDDLHIVCFDENRDTDDTHQLLSNIPTEVVS
jgi:hypothetical protein